MILLWPGRQESGSVTRHSALLPAKTTMLQLHVVVVFFP